MSYFDYIFIFIFLLLFIHFNKLFEFLNISLFFQTYFIILIRVYQKHQRLSDEAERNPKKQIPHLTIFNKFKFLLLSYVILHKTHWKIHKNSYKRPVVHAPQRARANVLM